MVDATLVLLQKQDSPLTTLLQETLVNIIGARLAIKSSLPLLREAYGPNGLVVWDVTAYEKEEIAELLPELASDRVGVLLAGDHDSPDMRYALEQVNSLGIIPPDKSSQALGLTLELAWAHHRRAHELRGQLESLRDELSDRLVVEKAKRLLMDTLGYSEDEAMRRMQHYSRNSNQKMVKVARQLLAGSELFGRPQHMG